MVSISLPRRRSLSLALPALDGAGLLAGLLYLGFFAVGFASFTDPDYWWHLRTGELIVETGSIPRHDVFSFTAAGEPWLAHEWLSEVLIYLGVSRLGYAATLTLVLIVVLAAFALMHRLLLRLGTPPLAATGLAGLGMLISMPAWTVRPQVVSWFMLAVFVSTLAGRSKPAWALVPLMALWANLHLGYAIGLGVVGLWFVTRAWDAIERRQPGELRALAAFVAACIAATALNPSGPAVLLHPLPFLPFVGDAADLALIAEWRSPDFGEAKHLPLLAGVVLLVGLGLTGRVRDRFAVLLAATFTVLALQSARYQPMFGIAYLPAAGLALSGLAGRGPAARASLARPAVNWALLAVAGVAALIAAPLLPHAQVHREPVTGGLIAYPEQGMEWVRRHRPEADVFAEYDWGGYALNALYPDGRVYIDGRADMYGGEIVRDYGVVVSTGEGWQQLLDQSGADVVVVRRNMRLDRALRSAGGWSLAFQGPVEAVFVRR